MGAPVRTPRELAEGDLFHNCSSTKTENKEEREGEKRNKKKEKRKRREDDGRHTKKEKKKTKEEVEKRNDGKKMKDTTMPGEAVRGGGQNWAKNKASSPSSCTSSSSRDDIAASSTGFGFSSPSCSFPMSRMRRLIAGSEAAGGNNSGNIRTTLDAVFLINKAAELFLEVFAEDAYACATRERKKSVSYKHLSSVVYDRKRNEFLSDFVPEKLRAEDALKVKSLVES